MAQLHQIVGAILRDIAQARVISDIYSRDISRHYEQDDIMRRFPVPRSDIIEVSVDLKFAISKVDVCPSVVEGTTEEYSVEVEVAGDKLKEFDESAISEIKIKAAVQNYVWEKVEQKGDKAVRLLVPQ